LNMNTIIHYFVHYAKACVQQRANPTLLPNVKDDTFWSIFEGVTKTDNVHYTLRTCLLIYVAFWLGFTGWGDLIEPETTGIATAVAALLSKFYGSAIVKNLQKLQGVVLGTVGGQLVVAAFHPCHQFTEAGIGTMFFFWMMIAMYLHFHHEEYAAMGIQLANFGGTAMMSSTCAESGDKLQPFSKIAGSIIAMSIMLVIDLVFARDRASDLAMSKVTSVWNAFSESIKRQYDPSITVVTFTKEEILGAINSADKLGAEADLEPRYWRLPWRAQTFTDAISEMKDFRSALTNLEHCLSKASVDGGDKEETFMRLLETKTMPKIGELFQAKFLSVGKLLVVFLHESHKRFPVLDDEDATKQFREEVMLKKQQLLEEVSNSEHFHFAYDYGEDIPAPRLQDDSLCQVSVVLACSDAMLYGMRQIQHAVLRSL